MPCFAKEKEEFHNPDKLRLFLSLSKIKWHWCGIALNGSNSKTCLYAIYWKTRSCKLSFLNQCTLALSIRYWLCTTLTYQMVRVFCNPIILIYWVVVINIWRCWDCYYVDSCARWVSFDNVLKRSSNKVLLFGKLTSWSFITLWIINKCLLLSPLLGK